VYIYLWGWTDYNDTDADFPRRRTEFCVKIGIEGDLRSEDCRFTFSEQPWQNGIDGCCLRNARPYRGNRCLKFLDTVHVDSVLLGGTIIVSSLSHFRSLEETGRWGAIADDLEASSLLTVRRGLIATENSPELELVNRAGIGLGMFGKFADVSGGGSIVMMPGAGFIHRTPEVFSYSASAGDLSHLTKAMCEDAKRRYNACLEITDLSKLRARIFEEGQIVEQGCKASDIFQPGEIQPVIYEARSRDMLDGGVIRPSPFKKDLAFQSQSEVRLLLFPKDGAQIQADRLTIKIRDPGSLFKEVFRNHPGGAGDHSRPA
jgi:hypothetical protein